MYKMMSVLDRVEDIIPHKRAEGDVPALPEFPDRTGKKGRPEIFRQLYSENFRGSDDDIHIS